MELYAFLEKISQKNGNQKFIFENGDKFFLQKGQKIILLTEDGIEKIPKLDSVKIVNADKWPFEPE